MTEPNDAKDPQWLKLADQIMAVLNEQEWEDMSKALSYCIAWMLYCWAGAERDGNKNKALGALPQFFNRVRRAVIDRFDGRPIHGDAS